MQLNHINIKAPLALLEQEKQFFCTILKLTEGPRPQFSHRGFWLYHGDNPIIHLSEGDALEPRKIQSWVDHLAFQSTGLKKFVQYLDGLKIDYTSQYINQTNTTQIFLKSALGIRIEVGFMDEIL